MISTRAVAPVIGDLNQQLENLPAQQEKLETILRWWMSTLQVARVSMHVYNDASQRFVHAVSSGVDGQIIHDTFEIPVGQFTIGQAAASETIVSIEDLKNCPTNDPFVSAANRFGIRSVFSVPVTFQNRVLATFTVYEKQSKRLNHHLRYLSIYAAQTIAQTLHRLLMASVDPLKLILERLYEGDETALSSPLIRPEVKESWLRCRHTHGHDGQLPEPKVLSPGQLSDLRRANFNLLRAMRMHFSSLSERIHNLHQAILLCDTDGWLIDILGNPEQLAHLAKDGIVLGRNLSEAAVGNTSVGTSLVTRQNVHFNGHEHYFLDFHDYCSAGAPILIGEGKRLLGSLGAIGRTDTTTNYLPDLIQSAAIAIGHWVELEQVRQDALLVHQSVISQLDYHVVFIDSNRLVADERHPIPLREESRAHMLELTKSGECSHQEVTLDKRTYLADVRNLWDHTGQLKGTLGIFRDITYSKQMEIRVQDAERMSMLATLAAGIAHEIRNPLTTARGFLQLFEQRLQSSEDKRFLGLTIQELDRINELVNDFMSLAKPEQNHLSHVNLTDLVSSSVLFILPEAALRGIRCTSELPEEPVWIWADDKQIKQVVLNLVQNALQACPMPENEVSIQVNENDNEVELIVSDTGEGMTADTVQRAFEPFYTTKETGTGLGLPVCKRIIEEHGGSIELDSKLGAGTKVYVRLPKRPPKESASS